MQNEQTENSADGWRSRSTVELAVTAEELRAICDATVRLTELRQRGCAHLCIENVAPEIMRKLLLTLRFHKEWMVNSSDTWSTGMDAYQETANVELRGAEPASSAERPS